MKKIFGLVMSIALLAGAALPASAQTRRGTYATRAAQQRAYERQQREYYERRQREYYEDRDDRSFGEKHRDKLTVAGGAAAGAVIGAVAGGKKGAVIGALVGAGASALYTYKLRDKDDDYDDYRWRR
jgi:hypothetical protein